jgi:hypothetical protein
MAPSVLLMEVVHLIVHVEDLTVLSEEDAEVIHLTQELEMELVILWVSVCQKCAPNTFKIVARIGLRSQSR